MDGGGAEDPPDHRGPSNAEYGVLKQFGGLERTPGVPGLNLPGLDITATAASYGVSDYEAGGTDDVAKLVREGIADRTNPTLINVPVTKVHIP